MLKPHYSLDNLFETTDLWTYLLNTNKKIVLYGMGDGADKILDVCERKGIHISGVFASDGFAKEKIFRSFKVVTYSKIKEQLGNFIVLVSFATQLRDVLDNIYSISDKDELYCPDVPVYGEGLFDSSFVKSNEQKIRQVYSLLFDEKSRQAFLCVLYAKLTGKIEYLKFCQTNVAEAYQNIVCPKDNGHLVDIGAYNGDTIREYLYFAKNTRTITAFEPDQKNFAKLIRFAEQSGIDISHFHNIACWDKKEQLTFFSRSGRGSAKTTSHQGLKEISIQADIADNYIKSPVDFINIDAEGSDLKVIRGLEITISQYFPTISCAIYHRNEDIFEIPLKLKELYGDCRLYIRHFPYLPAWDTNVYVKK